MWRTGGDADCVPSERSTKCAKVLLSCPWYGCVPTQIYSVRGSLMRGNFDAEVYRMNSFIIEYKVLYYVHGN